MKNNNKFEILISQKKRSWYELVLAAVFFGVLIYLLGIVVYLTYLGLSLVLFIRLLSAFILVGGFCLGYGLIFFCNKGYYYKS